MTLPERLRALAQTVQHLADDRPDPALEIVARRLLICAAEAQQMRRTADAQEDERSAGAGAQAELERIVAEWRPKV